MRTPVRRVMAALLFSVVLCACGPGAQSEECKKMIDCANALEAGSGDAAYGPTYGVNGSCWLTSGASSACTERCQTLVDRMASRPNAPAVCR